MLNLNEHLLRLIKDKQNDEARSLLTADRLSKTPPDIAGNTLLHHAASYGNEVVTQHLVDLGCDVDAQNQDLKTPIVLAVEARCESTVEVLLRANADIQILDNAGKSALRIVSDRTETTPLTIAKLFLDRVRRDAAGCRRKIARTLFEANWPLFYAVSTRDAEVTRIMLKLGSPIDAVATEYRITALHGAVLLVDPAQVKLLVDHGADVNVKCADGSAPLGCLHRFDDAKAVREIVRILLERGTRWTDCDVDVPMQIYDVCVSAGAEVVRTLMECGVDLRAKDANGETALHYLVENERAGVFAELKGRDFEVNAGDDFGLTPLHKAVWCGNVPAIRFLVGAGANVKAEADNGFPPIFYAFVEPHRSLYEPDEEEEDGGGFARDRRDRRIVEILLERGAEIEVADDRGTMSVFELSHFANSPLARIAVGRVAMLEVLGRPVGEIARKDVRTKRWMTRHFDSCKARYERMRDTRVYEAVTVLDLLTKSDKQILHYARNRQLVLNFAVMVDEGVPDCYHYRLVQRRLADAVVKIDLRKKAVVALNRIVEDGCSNPRVVADLVIGYLEERDWATLKKVY